MTRRAGMTMTEVLVALFIMALGVIAILTMFPLGMLNMGQALKDDRVAQSAITADGYMRTYWKAYVVENTSQDTNLIAAFDQSNNIPGNEPSNPVCVDPIGMESQGAPAFVGSTSSIPRRSLSLISTGANRPNMAIRTCTLLDGLTYGTNGSADTTSIPNVVQRDMRYNWYWILQRPVNKTTNTVTMQVVVYERRAPRFYAANQEVVLSVAGDPNYYIPAPGPGYDGMITPGNTVITINNTAGAVVMKGSWIMDATNSGSLRQAICYRVSSVTDDGTGRLNVELEWPIKRIDGNSNRYVPTIIAMTGVADVFTRPTLTP